MNAANLLSLTRHHLGQITDPILSVIFPTPCTLCGSIVESHALGTCCARCWSNSHFLTAADIDCRKCGAVAERAQGEGYPQCGQCSDHHYERAAAAATYEGAVRASILRLKSVPHIPTALTKHIADAFAANVFPGDATLMPVPLSKKRSLERGFNQAELIAAYISRRQGLDIDTASLQRIRHTNIHRVAMDQKAREGTVKKAFEVVRPRLVDGRKIILVDDVLTSGSTASACANVLKKSGAAEVYVFTVARAV